MFILDDLLIKLPAKGFMGILRKIADMADEEMNDEPRIKEELLLIQTLYETDQITEEDYQRREDELLERLTLLREQREEAEREQQEEVQ